ncbi:dihydrofolate reductase family protein [Isoptericola cucumis]
MSPASGARLPGMSIVTCDLGISLDGFSAGPHQSLDQPFGDGVGGGEKLHAWMFDHGDDHADEVAAIVDAGAFVMGRNMFTPGRGDWDLDWKGWWGDDPPYHAPVFVLTHHEREPLEMDGGTTFHFVTGGPEAALERAREAAGERNVSVAGGATTINEFLDAGLIDELRLHVAPVVLGVRGGVRIFDGVGPRGLTATHVRRTPEVTHLTYRR